MRARLEAALNALAKAQDALHHRNGFSRLDEARTAVGQGELELRLLARDLQDHERKDTMSDETKHPAHRYPPEGTEDRSITERFEAAEADLIRAMELAGEQFPLTNKIGEGLYELGRIRRELRGCWTEEAQDLRAARTQALRIRAVLAEAGRRSMHVAIDNALPPLRDIVEELSDMPVLHKLLISVAADLSESRHTLQARFEVREVADLAETDDEQEIGDRAELVREATRTLAALSDVDPKLTTRLEALADELDNA